MRLQDDESRVLRCLRDGFVEVFESVTDPTRATPRSMRELPDVTFARFTTILKKLQYQGLIDAGEELTKRGRHVASKLLPLPEPEVIPEPQQIEIEQPIEPIEETDWD